MCELNSVCFVNWKYAVMIDFFCTFFFSVSPNEKVGEPELNSRKFFRTVYCVAVNCAGQQ